MSGVGLWCVHTFTQWKSDTSASRQGSRHPPHSLDTRLWQLSVLSTLPGIHPHKKKCQLHTPSFLTLSKLKSAHNNVFSQTQSTSCARVACALPCSRADVHQQSWGVTQDTHRSHRRPRSHRWGAFRLHDSSSPFCRIPATLNGLPRRPQPHSHLRRSSGVTGAGHMS